MDPEMGFAVAQDRAELDIQSLPLDVMAEVLSRVASDSFEDLHHTQVSCKDFQAVANDPMVFARVTIDKFPVIVDWIKKPQVLEFLRRVSEQDNPNWLYRQGMLHYFSRNNIELGLENLRQATEKGHVEASYVYGMILLCGGGASTIHGLHILNDMKTKTSATTPSTMARALRDCRVRIEQVLRELWVRNRLICLEPKSCSHGDPIKVKETWEGIEEAHEPSCDICLWHSEVKSFIDMLH